MPSHPIPPLHREAADSSARACNMGSVGGEVNGEICKTWAMGQITNLDCATYYCWPFWVSPASPASPASSLFQHYCVALYQTGACVGRGLRWEDARWWNGEEGRGRSAGIDSDSTQLPRQRSTEQLLVQQSIGLPTVAEAIVADTSRIRPDVNMGVEDIFSPRGVEIGAARTISQLPTQWCVGNVWE